MQRLATTAAQLSSEHVGDVVLIVGHALHSEHDILPASIDDLEATRKRVTELSNTLGRRPVSATSVNAVITAFVAALNDHDIHTVTRADITATAHDIYPVSCTNARIDLN